MGLAVIERFEDIEAWKKARMLTKILYEVTSTGEFSKDFGLRDQIRRSAVSVISNIAEGFERRGDKEFQHSLAIAKGSAGEVRAQLHVALDAGLIGKDRFVQLRAHAEEASRMVTGLLTYLRKPQGSATA